MRNSITPTSCSLSGAILAGGQGRRMGHVNKGLVRHQGRYLFEYAADNLRPHVSDIIIVTNTETAQYQALGYHAIDDGEFRYQGPLAGIYAALSQAKTDYVAFASCDQGPLPNDVYPKLLATAIQSDVPAAILASGADSHPTCAVLNTNLQSALFNSLQNGQRRLMQWCKEVGSTSFDYPGIVFHNLNTKDDIMDQDSQ